ncbi:uroporphyrinogen-III C-methyltransferase [Labilibaculum sp. A4]|uniref:uroporphyrinogen-III C-methyltransferase n=1 Tax=Labilibaculum euxinus TaxID=2686357 RepID=A0A425Y3R3_9BACT|nr:uroporphyrinogen-III C-methyltransferase [Labilibaculum euxinus]MDQ1772544.1 uroporphyrinogen-III C-methyltransferase [Labilibaculum euxinus]MUP38912.1 uroporphyrinogen-III C-methyltransferase [Labilibaculum euxinus]MVB08117.1 uroporphyrinogen-III C-methyltransferase [Labilibaculum euxinus]MWN78170.1 uroporphyrinogen-III C-methyltransferase [Labilibaculum euxinus]
MIRERGKVSIVGAGPGDPELITLKAIRAIENAEVVLYDYLVNKELLGYCKPDCQIVYVGKKNKQHTYPQEEINKMLIEFGLSGKKIARLKGGDPFVFGRGAEEILGLQEHDIEFEVIPGITAGVAVPGAAGIPVTLRNVASSVAFFTGHQCENHKTEIQWDKIAAGIDTLVFYMGVAQAPRIVRNLMANGRKPETPVAMIRWGTLPEQEVMKGTLENIVAKMEQHDFKPPAIFIVGEVVAYSEQLSPLINQMAKTEI